MVNEGLVAYYKIREEFIKEGCSNYEATLLAYYSVLYTKKTNYGREKISNRDF